MARKDRLNLYKELLDERGELAISEFTREFEVSTPTAWRALKELIKAEEVEAIGIGRATKYRLLKRYDQSIRVPLAIDAWDIDEYVDSPLALRKPAGYQRGFLDDYIPNTSRYIPVPLAERLAQIGEMGSPSSDHVDVKRRIEKLVVDVSYGSSRLEGISTNYLDTEKLLAKGRSATSTEERSDMIMLLNHRDTIQFILENREADTSYVPMGFNLSTIQYIHALLMSDIHPDVEEIGKPRLREVSIEGSVYHPLSIPTEITDALNRVLEKCDQIMDPFEQSFFALVHLAYLQPFGDGNKRTSRMMANIPLLQANLCPISFLATPKRAYTSGLLGVYELNRIEMMRDVYVSSYEQTAHRIHLDKNREVVPDILELHYRSEIDGFVRDIIRMALDRSYINVVKREIDGINELNTVQKNDLFHIALEKSRKTPVALIRRYGVSLQEYQEWDSRRPLYLNTEVVTPVSLDSPNKAMSIVSQETNRA